MNPSSDLIPARRSSPRAIKRKKIDDDLVESSLVKTEGGRPKPLTALVTTTTPTQTIPATVILPTPTTPTATIACTSSPVVNSVSGPIVTKTVPVTPPVLMTTPSHRLTLSQSLYQVGFFFPFISVFFLLFFNKV